MDVEALISAIFKRSPIWDKRNKLYANRQVLDKSWKEISRELEQDETTIRRKWKYLRDNFAVEYSKRPVSGSGDGANNCPPSKWQYFQQLLFLKDIVSPRASTGSLTSVGSLQLTGATQSAEQDQENLDVTFQETSSQVASTSRDTVSETASQCSENMDFPFDEEICRASQSPYPDEVRAPRARKRKGGRDSYYENLIKECEERKLQYLFSKPNKNSEDEDSDLMFYKALLPHVRMIPQNQKLEFQSKILAVVQEFAYSRQPTTAKKKTTSVETDQSYIT